MNCSSDYWDALAPHHASIENNYLDLSSIRRIVHDIRSPVLVVGAGQGLIVAELLRNGFQTDGVDLSSEMIKYAKIRRGLDILHADAKAMPLEVQSYETIVYATGVVDFIENEALIRVILNEGRRILKPMGKIFVAFYRMSLISEEFLSKIGLLKNNVLFLRESLGIYRLNPFQTTAWVARKAGISYLRAAILSLRCMFLSTLKEKMLTFNMLKILRKKGLADSLINIAPEQQPYRNEPEIKNLFKRLAIPVMKLEATNSCCLVQI